jgi:hypothetical protein
MPPATKQAKKQQEKASHARSIKLLHQDSILQPDFEEQKSLVQETIEAAGHLCIFLLKFYCELNFIVRIIEFFWGAVKKYLREHCDYAYDGPWAEGKYSESSHISPALAFQPFRSGSII